MKPRARGALSLFLVLLPLLSRGLNALPTSGIPTPICNRTLQSEYCGAAYGGDLHTACRYCGVGLQCPSASPSGRGLRDPEVRAEILKRHNDYRKAVQEMDRFSDRTGKTRCLPELR